MSVVLMLCFKRSGGTVVNQCIGSLPNVVILSEVNPIGFPSDTFKDIRTVRAQAKQWYGIEVGTDSFVEGIVKLHERCQRERKFLVIRDWSYNNFRTADLLDGQPSVNRLLTYELLKAHDLDLKVFALARDAIDVWLSSGKPEMLSFFSMYLKYVQTLLAVENLMIFKFEDFCSAPDEFMGLLCKFTDLTFSASYKNYRFFDKVLGDIQVKGGSRGKIQGMIRPLPRKRIPKRLVVELNSCKDMILANQLLDYPTIYEAVPRELWIHDLVVRLRRARNIMIEKRKR